jgi:glutamine synthetase adenylyltransferase
VRNALTLRYGMPRDVIPEDEAEQQVLARMLGREDPVQMLQEFEHLMHEVREWVERDLFERQ